MLLNHLYVTVGLLSYATLPVHEHRMDRRYVSSSWNLLHVTELYNENNAQCYLHTIQQLWLLCQIEWHVSLPQV